MGKGGKIFFWLPCGRRANKKKIGVRVGKKGCIRTPMGTRLISKAGTVEGVFHLGIMSAVV